ncbi:MAG: hypothetical protein K8U03_12040 [Planctomycetia bacterium]|nr:hypothetical protein [Planctomycetia bacterium]
MRSFLFITVVAVFSLLAGMLLLYLAVDGNFGSTAAKPIAETKPIELAMQAYQDMYVEYPPCFGEEARTERRVRLMRHLIARNFRLSHGTPYDTSGVPIHTSKLFGFYRDSATIFRRDPRQEEGGDPLRFRTEPLYAFDESRLVDRDGDGWLEYAFTHEEVSAPFVYFDAATYRATTSTPAISMPAKGAVESPAKTAAGKPPKEPPKEVAFDVARLGTIRYPATGSALVEVWGQALPYLEKFTPDKPQETVWSKSDSFQLIAAGADHRYGPADATLRRFVTFPSGHTWATTDGTTYHGSELSAEEFDNLTNLTDATLGEAAAQAAAAAAAAEAATAETAAPAAVEQ